MLPIPLRRTLILLVAAAAAIAGTLIPAGAAQAAPPIPSSMSALGDSVTRGFNACGWFYDCTSESWSAGSSSDVNSHYLRILEQNPAIEGNNHNDASTGARMDALDGQAQTAADRGVDYVTILMGHNDACRDTEEQMTSVSDFEAQFRQAMSTLNQGVPDAAIFVGSVVDVKRLWEIGKDDSWARWTWANYGICQSMLANPTSEAQEDVDRRDRVQQRVIDYNAVLAQVCSEYSNCKFDGNALFDFRFELDQVSGWDNFHPNSSGQAVLADVSYAAGWGW